MATICNLVLTVCLVITGLTMSQISVNASDKQDSSWVGGEGRCQGSIAKCMTRDEFVLDNEINHRLLTTTANSISYGALERNTVPCSRRGASYNNCQSGVETNPYNRGCTKEMRCRN